MLYNFIIFQIFRHGDRTPDANDDEKYPNDPYLNYSYYPMGRGQLTNVRISPLSSNFHSFLNDSRKQ